PAAPGGGPPGGPGEPERQRGGHASSHVADRRTRGSRRVLGRCYLHGVPAAAVADLPLLASGKVRELYDLGDRLLMVASDRISTYDVVHPTPIPDKGRVLTGLSVLWFDLTKEIAATHFVSATDGVPEDLRGSALRVQRLNMLPVECVVRGYITGSGWKDYQRTGTVSGLTVPDGLVVADKLTETMGR